jgi:hypothetical protein
MIKRRQTGVSPIVGLLLLLGLSVGLFALASNIFFSTIDVSASPEVQLDTSHTYDGASDANVTIKIVRNLNVQNLEYFTEDENNNIVKSRTAFGSNDAGTSETISDVDEDHTVVITGDVGTDSFVLQTYIVPPEDI